MQRRAIALFTPSIHDMMEVARLADDAGFDSVWNGEFFNRNGLVTLAAVALATQRAKIATGIAYAYMRNPVLNATGAMDLDELSGGRMILGLGSGTKSMNEGWYGQPFEPRSAAKMKECLALLRKIWASHKGVGVRFEGEFYRINIPAFVRPRAVVVSHDRKQAIQEAKNQIAFYASVKSYEGILNLHGWERQKLAIWEHFKTFNLPKMAEAVTDDMVEQIAIAGTPDECRDQLKKWEGLLDLPILYTPTAGVRMSGY